MLSGISPFALLLLGIVLGLWVVPKLRSKVGV